MKNNKNVIIRKKSIGNGDLSKHISKSLKATSKSKTNTQKFEKGKEDYINSLNKVKVNRDNLQTKLKSVPFQYSGLTGKLPRTVEEIQGNEDLVKLLLKNPDDMTPEEKVYISNFNEEEFKVFINFLKIKQKELGWRGNDWGSGHYINNFISIYRNTKGFNNVYKLNLYNIYRIDI
jgi:hypothetical protein